MDGEEYALVIEGRRLQEQALARLVLDAACLIRNPWTGEGITAAHLLGEVDRDDGIYDVAAELELAREMREEKLEEQSRGWLDRLGVDEAVCVTDDGLEVVGGEGEP